MEDKQIINLLFSRAEQALQVLKERYSNALYKIAMNILGNHHDAEETTNDTYLAFGMQYRLKNPTHWLLMYTELQEI